MSHSPSPDNTQDELDPPIGCQCLSEDNVTVTGRRRLKDITYTAEEICLHNIYNATIAKQPTLAEKIMSANIKEVWHITVLYGQTLTCLDNTNTLKQLIINWIMFSPGKTVLNIDLKYKCGFNNSTITKLIAPVDAEVVDDNYIKLLCKGTTSLFDSEGKWLVNGTDHCFFMYAGCKYNLQNPLKGFLKGELMVKAFRAIFICPSSAGTSSITQSRATKKGNVALSNMMKVTPGSIAYITTQTYFVIVSKNIFSALSVPEIEEMYDSIYTIFKSKVPFIKDYTKELLNWWTVLIFLDTNQVQRHCGKGSLGRLKQHYQLTINV
ncbi:uncharacterized protein FOMMEDRAFT_30734 [Fomitiporia mediterranea MF3/22]|uniref:uncharacterized protein n=1 Tax=Fomitiporia mediterranea (strain MF3/22) TaxID=694068 RepID=UPI000440966E|nr:uncharacterized protein FOMMEDRAFT_30734 [Fomitiporia mediterranea MF3/22]EJD00043.1 hypothetical protein FOMMEDRAFT_30734 [Fomitiporia mediterranea MF3/22]